MKASATRAWTASLILFWLLGQSGVYADQAPAPNGGTASNVNSGLSSGSIIGNGNMQATDTGVAVNGSANGANLNNNQNSLENRNQVNAVLLSPNQAGGGNSALIMPRNPLPMPNAALGRSNFGLQFGVQNNPGLSALTGGGNSLGWFLQAGLSIPFGRIPDVYRNPDSARMDEQRMRKQGEERLVFEKRKGGADPKLAATSGKRPDDDGLSAYNYATVPSARLTGAGVPDAQIAPIGMPQPRVLALAPADVYTRPLNTGERIGFVEVGREYPYLGHTRSGWVKVLMPNGAEGWVSTHFEYLKYDFTEVDTLAVDPKAAGKPAEATAGPPVSRPPRRPSG